MPPRLSLEDCANLLHKCKQERSSTHSLRLLACMLGNGLYSHPSVGSNHLLSLLVGMDCVDAAHLLFDCLLHQNESSWNILITGYAKCGHAEQLLGLYKQMPKDQFSSICSSAFVALLKACIELKDMETGNELHSHIARMGLHEDDVFVGSTLVDMYAKCGTILKAEEVFHKLLVPNLVSWNSLLTGYVEHALGVAAFKCFEQMQYEGVYPDAVTIISILKSCAIIESASAGHELHIETSKRGLDQELRIGSALVDMYGKCGLLADAQSVFNRITVRDVIIWTALITGYTDCGETQKAISWYKGMQFEHISPNSVTFACVLKACSSMRAIHHGLEIHRDIALRGERDLLVSNALMNFYATGQLLAEARHVFNKLSERDQVSWNTLIAACSEQGHPQEAVYYFFWMRREGISPDAVTFMCILKAYLNLASIFEGHIIHIEIIKRGIDLELVVGSALVDFYARRGSLKEAQDTFEKLQIVDVVSWTSLIAGYAEHGLGEKAVGCFEHMLQGGFSPTAATIESCLRACGILGAMGKVYEIHVDIAKKGWEQEEVVGSSLVDSYAKCGSIHEAQAVFNKLPLQNVISWTALIAGYTQAGAIKHVFFALETMMAEGIEPNAVTISSVLSACSRAGILDVAQAYFEAINACGCILYEHYTCMLDLFCRAGQFERAIVLIKKMPLVPRRMAWCTILGACQRQGTLELGRSAFQQALTTDEGNSALYISVLNLYSNLANQRP